MRTAHLGLLWHQFRDAFPKTDERPPLDNEMIQVQPVVPLRIASIFSFRSSAATSRH